MVLMTNAGSYVLTLHSACCAPPLVDVRIDGKLANIILLDIVNKQPTANYCLEAIVCDGGLVRICFWFIL